MVGAGHNEQLFVVALQLFVNVFTEITLVGFFTVYQHDGTAYFAGIRQ